MRARCELHDLGRIDYGQALELQRSLVQKRKQGLIPNQLLILEHPHVITLGRNGRLQNLLANQDALRRAGIAFFSTDRGGDVTYHGPGQVVGYPIFDLREWKRDVVAYVRALEQVLIDTLQDFGVAAGRIPSLTGVWVEGKKIAAIGVHISRWITSHGFALNAAPDLSCFQYIIPCGLARPVTSMAELGARPPRAELIASLARHFSEQFGLDIVEPVRASEEAI
jgi:lipoyl(octanoyl) transferase